ncbi:hypothetical protein ABTZ92_05555, partial [Streptomyces albidoflavus]
MRTARLLTGTVRAAAALGAGLALSAAPAAYADAGGGGRAAVEPRQVAPGAAVTLMTGACAEEGQGGGTGPIYYCGSYFKYGFHEDAYKSAVDLCFMMEN